MASQEKCAGVRKRQTTAHGVLCSIAKHIPSSWLFVHLHGRLVQIATSARNDLAMTVGQTNSQENTRQHFDPKGSRASRGIERRHDKAHIRRPAAERVGVEKQDPWRQTPTIGELKKRILQFDRFHKAIMARCIGSQSTWRKH